MFRLVSTTRLVYATRTAICTARPYSNHNDSPRVNHIEEDGEELRFVSRSGPEGDSFEPARQYKRVTDIDKTDFWKLYQDKDYMAAATAYDTSYTRKHTPLRFFSAALEVFNTLGLFNKTLGVYTRTKILGIRLPEKDRANVLIAKIRYSKTESDLSRQLRNFPEQKFNLSTYELLLENAYKARSWTAFEWLLRRLVMADHKEPNKKINEIASRYFTTRVREAKIDEKLVSTLNKRVPTFMIQPLEEYYKALLAFAQKGAKRDALPLSQKLVELFDIRDALSVLVRTGQIKEAYVLFRDLGGEIRSSTHLDFVLSLLKWDTKSAFEELLHNKENLPPRFVARLVIAASKIDPEKRDFHIFSELMNFLTEHDFAVHSSAHEALTETNARLNNVEETEYYLNQFKQSRKHQPVPFGTYSTVMLMYTRRNKVQKVEELFEEMCMYYQPHHVHNILLNVYERTRNYEKADKLYRYMKEELLADSLSAEYMFGVYTNTGSYDAAEECLSILESNSPDPSLFYARLIKLYLNVQEDERAKKLYDQMRTKQIEPDFEVYCLFQPKRRLKTKTDEEIKADLPAIPTKYSVEHMIECSKKSNQANTANAYPNPKEVYAKQRAEALFSSGGE